MVFDRFPALPTEGILYKILLSGKKGDIRQEVQRALTADTYMTVAEGKLIQIMSTVSTKWNGVKTMLDTLGIQPNEAVYFGDDNDDIACFEVEKGGKVQIIHDFASAGYEQRKEYDCFWDWFMDAVKEMIKENQDKMEN